MCPGWPPAVRARIYSPGQTGWVAKLVPDYFALVMATGIVSIAAHFHGSEWIARGLFALNLVAYVVLWGLTFLRLAWFRTGLINDLTRHSRGAVFLTTAAATCVLGSQFALLTPWLRIAEGLWFLGIGLSLVLSYTFITGITVGEAKPSLDVGISGTWLLLVVATESIGVLGVLVAPAMASTEVPLLTSLAAYCVGAVLYGFFATLIVYRWVFFGMRPEDFTPGYWINMGALAITTLAGALLVKASTLWALLQTLASFLTGSTIFFWAAATWWIPLLVALELWRHLRGRVPFSYGPEYWAAVFPLGMYAVANDMLARVSGLTFLSSIAECFTVVALVAWTILFIGMIRSSAPFVLSVLRRRYSG